MSEAKGQHEPSMEEILASIRRIIAEDGDTPSAPADGKPGTGAGRNDEVLELTEVVEEDGTVVSLSPGAKKPAAEPPPPPPLPPPEPVFSVEPEPEPEPAPPPPPSPPPPVTEEPDSRLLSQRAAAASVAALSQLGRTGSNGLAGTVPLGNGDRTLESIVLELLRPMLKEWLDAHLPPLVERLVQEEIQRMSREAQGR